MLVCICVTKHGWTERCIWHHLEHWICLSESSPRAVGMPHSVQFEELEQSLQKLEQVVNYFSILGSNKLVLTMTSLSGAPILPPGDTKANEMIPAK